MKDSILLKEARANYPIGTLFLSSTGLLKSPMRVSGVRMSDNYKNVVTNSSGGVLYSDGTWAKKI